jgi:hypothetical protein
MLLNGTRNPKSPMVHLMLEFYKVNQEITSLINKFVESVEMSNVHVEGRLKFGQAMEV